MFPKKENKYKLNIYDQDKQKYVSIHLSKDQYDLAIKDMDYAKTLWHEYEKSLENKDSFNGITIMPNNIVAEEKQDDSIQETLVGNPQETSQKEGRIQNNDDDVYWSDEETKLLICLYADHKDDFCHAKRKKHVWDIIAEKMNAHNCMKTVTKCERKWINLLRVYRSIKDNKGPKKSGRGSQSYKYFELLDDILGDKPSNNTDSLTVEVGVNRNINSDITDEELDSSSTTSVDKITAVDSPSGAITPQSSRSSRKRNPSKKGFEENASMKQKRHEERMQMEKEKLAVEKQKVEVLKDILKKLHEQKEN